MRFITLLFFSLLMGSCQSPGNVEIIEIQTSKDLIPEGIALHPKTRQIHLSSLHLDKIVHFDESGKNPRELFPTNEFGYSEGVGMEAKEDILYALGRNNRTNQSRLFLFDFFNNKLFASLGIGDKTAVSMNDLAVENSGKVYMTDTEHSRIILYNPENAKMDIFLEHEEIKNPNGITISDDESKLFIDSRSSGIRIVDINSKKVLNEPHPASAEKGIDGLKYYKGNLYGIFNGKELGRENHGLMKFTLSEDETTVLDVSPILVNHPKMNVPTTFDIVDGDFYILANSQLHNLNEAKNEIIDSSKLTNTFILKMRVDEKKSN